MKFSQYINEAVFSPTRLQKQPLSQIARRVLHEAEQHFSYLTDDQIENFGEEIKNLVMDNDWKSRWGYIPRSEDD